MLGGVPEPGAGATAERVGTGTANPVRDLPRGETRTYAQIASAIRKPRAVRAVANACASNPVAVLVPCHRIVRTDGTMGGYRWGLERKQELLEREHETA